MSRNLDKRIWITWLNQRRNKELSKSLRCTLYEFQYNGSRLLRYIFLSIKTIKIINSQTPTIIFAQNPSLLLPILLLLVRNFFRFKLVVDAHNAGLAPLEGKYATLNNLARIVQRKSDLTLVSNSALRDIVRANGGRAFVLPDKIPYIPQKNGIPLRGDYNFLLVCSFSRDEPISQAISAMSELSETIFLYISGNYSKIESSLTDIPDNVIFTGFVSDEEYFNLLHSVDGVLNLTYRDNCLLCGAYETVSVGKPLILSNKTALKNYFNRGAVFVENTKKGIKKGILEIVEDGERLCNEAEELRKELSSSWALTKIELDNVLNQLSVDKA